MTPRTLKISSALVAGSLLAAGCSNPNESPGVFSTNGGAAAGAIARGMGANTAESVATGAAPGAIIAATTYIIAKHEATERQRRIAEARAHAVYQRMFAQNRRETAPQPQQPAARRVAEKKPAAKKLPRYIAVDTEKDARTAPQAKKSVMIWDTQAGQVVGSNVYDVQSPPPVGSTSRFETYTAQYVGSGE